MTETKNYTVWVNGEMAHPTNVDALEAWQIAQALELKGHTFVEVWKQLDTEQPAYDGIYEVQVWDLPTTLLSEGYDPDQGPSQRTPQRRAMPANF